MDDELYTEYDLEFEFLNKPDCVSLEKKLRFYKPKEIICKSGIYTVVGNIDYEFLH